MPLAKQTLSRPAAPWRVLAIALAGAALITLGAKVQIPFWPVPMTLHTLAVFTLAAALGPRAGIAAMATYLAAGAAGLPVFSGTPERGIGLAYMVGPTGGYLLGYLLAAGVIGWLAQGRGMAGQALAMLAGLAVVYAVGLLWLAGFVPASGLLAAGFAPFILEAAQGERGIHAINGVITSQQGPHTVIAAVSVAFDDAMTAVQIEACIERIEAVLQRTAPDVVALFVKPQTPQAWAERLRRRQARSAEGGAA